MPVDEVPDRERQRRRCRRLLPVPHERPLLQREQHRRKPGRQPLARTRVSLHLQQGFSIGSAAVGHWLTSAPASADRGLI